MEQENERKPMPYLSLAGAVGFALAMGVLLMVEATHRAGLLMAAQQTRVLIVMVGLLFAFWCSIVSLITAWCPIILGGDRRPYSWVIPQVLAWILFVQMYDWASLIPRAG